MGDSSGRRNYLTLLLSENFPAKTISSSHILRRQELERQGIASPLCMRVQRQWGNVSQRAGDLRMFRA